MGVSPCRDSGSLPDGGSGPPEGHLYTAEELKSSPAYNEALPRGDCQDGLRVRLHGPGSSRIAWSLGDPVDSGRLGGLRESRWLRDWRRHVRQFVCIRQALVRAGARTATVTGPARQFAGRRRSSGPARADPGGQRPRPRHPPERATGLSDRDGTLTPGETQVAVWLAEGKSVRDMAEATGRTEGAIYRHLKNIYQKQSISRQADLVRLVLSLAE